MRVLSPSPAPQPPKGGVSIGVKKDWVLRLNFGRPPQPPKGGVCIGVIRDWVLRLNFGRPPSPLKGELV